MQACGSCHDDVDFAAHMGGQTDNSSCQSCHNVSGIAGSVIDKHRNERLLASSTIEINVISIVDTAPGQFPVITFSVIDPTNGDAPYDIKTDPFWTTGTLRVALAWNSDDFTNTGVSETNKPFYAATDALVNAVDNGDGTYTVTSGVAIPDGTTAPFQAASGSGMLTFEGRARIDEGTVAFFMDPVYFSIDEADGVPVPRRQVVAVENCNQCHAQLAEHGANRTNPEGQCQGCHNPRIATDAGESIDFKRMIHGIHGAGFREEALVIRGEPFDTSVVHFPGEIADCHTCHVNDSFTVPLAGTTLASTRDMGLDLADPADDLMISPTAAVCSACHDNSLAQTHMEQNGADFSATLATSANNSETCSICHGTGSIVDVQSVHHDPAFDD
jgi:OmcA/MtrC family decaheme c-type cytochrome